MARDTLQYDKMVEGALRGVVREALTYISKNGLPGNHHFYLTFRTDHPGVVISDTLRGQYPNDMTVVLQHQYWGLEVNDDHFVVNLSFSNMPERLQVPYAAMMSFVDPSVKFGLQFQPLDGETASAATAPETKAASKPIEGEAKPAELKPLLKVDADKPNAAKSDGEADGKTAADKPEAAASAGQEPDADPAKAPEKVVSLDAFRKK